MAYKIYVNDFVIAKHTEEHTSNPVATYPNRCLSASFGGAGVASEVIPWEGTEYNPWDYKYENGEFVLEPIVIPEPTPEPSQLDRIEAQTMWTAMMTDTLLEV